MFKANCGSFPGLRSEVPQTDGLKQQKRILPVLETRSLKSSCW